MTRPYTIIFSTMTIDGKIASSSGYSILSCRCDKLRLYLLRGYADAIMVGANTVLVDNPRLVRRVEPKTDRYYRVVVDCKLRLEPSLRLFSVREPPVIIVTCSDAPAEKKQLLRQAGAEILEVGERGTIDLAEALSKLYEIYDIRLLLVEGGGVLNYSLVKHRVVDEIRLTVTPYVFAAGRSMFHDPLERGFTNTSESPRLRLICMETCPCGRCVHLAYKVEDIATPPTSNASPPPPCLAKELERLCS